MPKNNSLKKKDLVPNLKPEPEYSQTYCFHKVVDNVEHITYMKFQNISRLDAKIWGKTSKIPQSGAIPTFMTPMIFFSKFGLCHFWTIIWCPNFMQKIRKN